jgi:hypothetical protein
MKLGKWDIPPKKENKKENNYADPVSGSSVYDNRSIERKKEASMEFDEFMLSIKDLNYWKSIKDRRFEQYGGHEIDNYSNDVGLLS